VERAEEVATFQQRLGTSYELVETGVTPQLRVYVGDRAVDAPQPTTGERLFRFRDREERWWVALSSSSLGFEASRYRSFPDFAEEFQRVLAALTDVFSPITQTRFGMRYVNEISDQRLEEGRFSDILQPALVQPIGSELGRDLVSSLSELRFRQPDGLFVLRHGVVEKGTYLLDFDYFVDDERPFDEASILELAANYHSVTESLFVWSLAPAFLEELRSRTGDHAG
jgi:uncharacterized protein (TIGR04255 family)